MGRTLSEIEKRLNEMEMCAEERQKLAAEGVRQYYDPIAQMNREMEVRQLVKERGVIEEGKKACYLYFDHMGRKE